MHVSIARDHSHACRRREKGKERERVKADARGTKKNMKAYTSSTPRNLKWARIKPSRYNKVCSKHKHYQIPDCSLPRKEDQITVSFFKFPMRARRGRKEKKKYESRRKSRARVVSHRKRSHHVRLGIPDSLCILSRK